MLFSAATLLFYLLELAVIGRVIASWLDASPSNAIVRALHVVTEPFFEIVRPIARKIPGPLDWSPMLVIMGLWLLRRILGFLF